MAYGRSTFAASLLSVLGLCTSSALGCGDDGGGWGTGGAGGRRGAPLEPPALSCTAPLHETMRVVLGPRLRIHRDEDATTILWRRLTAVDIVAAVVLPLAAVWGIASALGAEEIAGMRVLAMPPLATAIYWAIVAGPSLHFVLNRGASLHLTPETIAYRVGRWPGRTRTVERPGARVSIHTRENQLAETNAGRPIEETTLTIQTDRAPPLRIDDLSEADAQQVRRLIDA